MQFPESFDIATFKFPTLPATLIKVNAVLNNPESTTHELVEAISTPSFVVRLLQVANSPAMRTSKSISTVNDAVLVLGRAIVQNIVVCVSMRDLFSCSDLVLAQRIKAIWTHSAEVAATVNLLARRNKLLPDVALTAGLLHTVGALPIIDFFETSGTDHSLLDEYLNKYSAMLGRKVLEYWEFPTDIVEATDGYALHSSGRYAKLVVAAHYEVDNNDERLDSICTVEEYIQLKNSAEYLSLVDSIL